MIRIIASHFACPLLAIIVAAAISFNANAPAQELCEKIDRHIEAGCAAAGIAPAELANDATYLRRLSLDLIGRIATPAEVREFLASQAADRRSKLARSLVASPGFSRQMATFWRRTWVPQADSEALEHVADELDEWIAFRIARRDGLDAIARDLLSAPNIPVIGKMGETAPSGFLVANEHKPEVLAGSAAAAFLGLNLSCAQCHDHPFADWSQDQFWELAAFFARPDNTSTDDPRPKIVIVDTSRSVAAKTPDGAELPWPKQIDRDTSRKLLAQWMTSEKNPWFARQAANKLWSHFFGVPLVGPFDDPNTVNAESNRLLLDELASEFAAGGFNVEKLAVAIVTSRAYQRAVAPATGDRNASPLFAAAFARNLSGEQLYDSLRAAAGFPAPRDGDESARLRRERRQFASAFHLARPVTDSRTMLQALAILNGPLSAAAASPTESPTLQAAQSPIFDSPQRMELLFLAALGRPPRADEINSILPYLKQREVDNDSPRALSDIFWALLNSSEFNTNH